MHKCLQIHQNVSHDIPRCGASLADTLRTYVVLDCQIRNQLEFVRRAGLSCLFKVIPPQRLKLAPQSRYATSLDASSIIIFSNMPRRRILPQHLHLEPLFDKVQYSSSWASGLRRQAFQGCTSFPLVDPLTICKRTPVFTYKSSPTRVTSHFTLYKILQRHTCRQIIV